MNIDALRKSEKELMRAEGPPGNKYLPPQILKIDLQGAFKR